MKGKYFPNTNFLDAALGLNGSFSWNSIWGSKSLVKEGLIWRVGDGKLIDVYRDPWLTDEQGRFVLSPRIDGISVVKDLIKGSRMEWKADLILESFNERYARCILAIPISMRAPANTLTWAYSNDGLYSVKTAYMLGKSCNFDNFHQAWVILWKLDTTPKVRHFLWRVCTGSLPVRALLKRRHMLDEDNCPWCIDMAETLNHALFHCPTFRDLWR